MAWLVIRAQISHKVAVKSMLGSTNLNASLGLNLHPRWLTHITSKLALALGSRSQFSPCEGLSGCLNIFMA